ncbi:MAG: VWA domain-containing protein [Treponematales bacterium]
MRTRSLFPLTLALALLAPHAFGQDAAAGADNLTLSGDDLRIEQRPDGGFHLFIRRKPGLYSVLLTESTRDPEFQEDNYAFRAAEWNAVNGDEIRVLDGVPIPKERGIYSLIDSTPEPHPELGEAFHLYLPYLLNFGYENTRHGEIYVVDGAYLNIRAFALPYADYRGGFRDNPFILRVNQKPFEGPPEANFMKDTEESFAEIARQGAGSLVYSRGPEDLVDKIRETIAQEAPKSLDLVLCLDTTASMKDDIDAVRTALVPMLSGIADDFQDFRIGMVLYKDYQEEYLTKVIPFTRDFAEFQRALDAIRVRGGRDTPEAVYEALYDGAVRFEWEGDVNMMTLIGDAPPHKRQRGKVSKEMVDSAVAERGIKVHAIILPQ